MVTAIGYAYPWDFAGDPGAVRRAVDIGVEGVAVAAAYHTTRAATPLHPARRMVTAEHAACYVPVRAERYGRLVPQAPSWTEPDAFLAAQAQLRAAGLKVHAWTVLTHSSILGAANPDLVVRNAFGEPYHYALCPAAQDVREYCANLVGEIVEQAHPDGLILEACGPLGVDHGGHHDKLEFAGWTKAQRDLLSLCFCVACQDLYRDTGIEPEHLAGVVRDSFATATSVEEALGELAEPVRGVRTGLAARLRAELPTGDLHVTVHGSLDPWRTGAFTTIATGLSGVDSLVLNWWAPNPVAAQDELKTARSLSTSVQLGAYLRPDTIPSGEQLAGLDELHLYHLGLVPETALRRFAETVAAVRQPLPQPIGGSLQ